MRHPRAPSPTRISPPSIVSIISLFPTLEILVSREGGRAPPATTPVPPAQLKPQGSAVALLLPAAATCCVQGHLTSSSGSIPRDQPFLGTLLRTRVTSALLAACHPRAQQGQLPLKVTQMTGNSLYLMIFSFRTFKSCLCTRHSTCVLPPVGKGKVWKQGLGALAWGRWAERVGGL